MTSDLKAVVANDYLIITKKNLKKGAILNAKTLFYLWYEFFLALLLKSLSYFCWFLLSLRKLWRENCFFDLFGEKVLGEGLLFGNFYWWKVLNISFKTGRRSGLFFGQKCLCISGDLVGLFGFFFFNFFRIFFVALRSYNDLLFYYYYFLRLTTRRLSLKFEMRWDFLRVLNHCFYYCFI